MKLQKKWYKSRFSIFRVRHLGKKLVTFHWNLILFTGPPRLNQRLNFTNQSNCRTWFWWKCETHEDFDFWALPSIRTERHRIEQRFFLLLSDLTVISWTISEWLKPTTVFIWKPKRWWKFRFFSKISSQKFAEKISKSLANHTMKLFLMCH